MFRGKTNIYKFINNLKKPSVLFVSMYVVKNPCKKTRQTIHLSIYNIK